MLGFVRDAEMDKTLPHSVCEKEQDLFLDPHHSAYSKSNRNGRCTNICEVREKDHIRVWDWKSFKEEVPQEDFSR